MGSNDKDISDILELKWTSENIVSHRNTSIKFLWDVIVYMKINCLHKHFWFRGITIISGNIRRTKWVPHIMRQALNNTSVTTPQTFSIAKCYIKESYLSIASWSLRFGNPPRALFPFLRFFRLPIIITWSLCKIFYYSNIRENSYVLWLSFYNQDHCAVYYQNKCSTL